jgi:putative membrane protein
VSRTPLLLHPVDTLGASGFSIHWSTVIGILALAGLYGWRARVHRVGTTGQKALFACGLVTMFFALNGPLHDLSDDYLFSAHMIQHLVLVFVVAPLLLAGTPGAILRPALDWPGVRPVAQWLTRPVVCYLSFNIVFAAWHLPPLYNLAMAEHPVHIVEHLMFLVTAVLMWWPLLSPMPEMPRLPYPGQMLYCFLMSIPMSIVAVYVSLADHVLYPAYAAAPRVWGLSPLEDQQLGGLIMWIPGAFYIIGIMTVVFFKWAATGEDTRAAAQVDYRATSVGRPR